MNHPVARRHRVLVLAVFLILPALLAFAADHEEGGYAGTKGEGHDTVVYNFLKHFTYNQYYWTTEWQWHSGNDERVDAMDIAVFGGHGSPWSIKTISGWIDLSTIADTGAWGWGDTDADFIAFESCKVVPGDIDKADWWTKWVQEPNGAWDGVHQIMGFRTDSYQSTDQDVTDYFGARVRANYAIWQSWFDASNEEARSDEMASVVFHPPAENDTYANMVADPPYDSNWIGLWYQY
ncbi:MAG TPA: DUF6345 domain-containing protein [Thermoanaerobaculia bacterium]|jgi:ABC-type cobalt transport system substrate-binding protein|nr:DUF6345 domain-containing protein [Thermoanaerobaculia bacterium]